MSCASPRPPTETTKALLNQGADFPPGETDMKRARRTSSCSVRSREAEESSEITAWTIFGRTGDGNVRWRKYSPCSVYYT